MYFPSKSWPANLALATLLTGCGIHTTNMRQMPTFDRSKPQSSNTDRPSNLTDYDPQTPGPTTPASQVPAEPIEHQGDTLNDENLIDRDAPTKNLVCSLPKPSLSLLGWGEPTGQGSINLDEVIALCKFQAAFIICAIGVDPTTSAQAVLGCSEFTGPNPKSSQDCIAAANALMASQASTKTTRFVCAANRLEPTISIENDANTLSKVGAEPSSR